MARFVMANRRAGKFHEGEKMSARNAVDRTFDQQFARSVAVVGDTAPADTRERRVIVFDADPAEIAAKAAAAPSDVMIEPEILHRPLATLPLELDRLRGFGQGLDVPAGEGEVLSAVVRGDGAPLPDAEAVLVLRGFGSLSTQVAVRSGPNGEVRFGFSSFWQPTAIIVIPAGGFWSMVVRGPVDGQVIDCPSLPRNGPLAWWHRLLGIDAHDAARGSGVKVGVVDSGCGPHPFLAHAVLVGAFIDGNFDPNGGADVDSHGTHVSGAIGARPPAGSTDYVGVGPGVELFAARVFPPNRGANQGDIANAIDALSRARRVDLINMSLGSPMPSDILRDAMRDALERGTLCICAAGNSAGPIEWPAGFPEAAAITAIGSEGWGPAGSLASIRQPESPDRFGQQGLYLANFSCFGDEADACAGGVGIIAPVPERFGLQAPYASMDGTSMASPLACAALAAHLSTDAQYAVLPRNVTRAQHARDALDKLGRSLGLAARFQGRGVPRIG